MPKIKANDITMNYDQQGNGEPLLLIPYLAVDHACYAFQVAEYAKHFTCVSLDLLERENRTNSMAPTLPRILPMTLPRLCKLWGSAKRTSPGCLLVRPSACG